MTELGFIVALEIAGFVLALALARTAAPREPGASVYRVVSAIERALRSFLGRARGAIGGAGLVAVVSVVATYVLFGRVGSTLVVVGGLVVGAALSLTCAALCASHTGRAAGSTHASSRLGFNAALTTALRAGGAVGIGTETLSTLGAFALFGVTYLAEGGRGAASAAPASLTHPCLVVAGYALGATLSALVIERAGATYRVGAESGRGRATFDASGSTNDPRNPALVAGLVGDHVGTVATGSAALFALSALATAATFASAMGLGANVTDELHVAALPLVVRSFGVVACAAGTLAARADEAQSQGLALFRGLASAFCIALFGVAGGCYWLAAGEWWLFAMAGVLGLGAAALPSAVALALAQRQARPVREAVEALRAGASAAFGASIGYALERAVAPLVGLIGLALLAGALGERAAGSGGGLAGLHVFTLSMLALAPYALTVLGLSAVAKSAKSTAALSKLDTESDWRLQRLDDVGFVAAAGARGYLFVSSAFAVLPALAGVVGFGAGAASAPPNGATAATLLCATLGAIVVLAQAGQGMRAAARSADEVALEVDRQLGFSGATPGGGGAGGLSEGWAPSYRSCEELTQKAALAGLFFDAIRPVLPLLPLGIGLGLVYRVGGSRLAAAALSTFVATAAVTALGAALAVDGARTVHGGARRMVRLERETAGKATPISEDVLANILGIAAGPAAVTQALLAASFALTLIVLLV